MVSVGSSRGLGLLPGLSFGATAHCVHTGVFCRSHLTAGVSPDASAVMAEPLPKRRRITGKRPPSPSVPALAAAPADAPAPARVLRRPARAYTDVCCGREGVPCRFAARGTGQPAAGNREGRCSFCSLANLRRALETAAGRRNVVRLLRAWARHAPVILEAAFAESSIVDLPEADREQLRKDSTERTAQDLLAKRASVAAPPSPEELQGYQEKVRQDRALVLKKFFPERQRTVRHAGHQWKHPMTEEVRANIQDIAPNDAGLPVAAASVVARNVETWCKRGSWQICKECYSVETVHLKEPAALRASTGQVGRCKNCVKPAEKRIWVPQPEEVPKALRGLSRAQIQALRPLDVDCGPEWKADFGYYLHSSMIRFAWAEEDVEDKVKALPTHSLRKQAKKAGTRRRRRASV